MTDMLSDYHYDVDNPHAAHADLDELHAKLVRDCSKRYWTDVEFYTRCKMAFALLPMGEQDYLIVMRALHLDDYLCARASNLTKGASA